MLTLINIDKQTFLEFCVKKNCRKIFKKSSTLSVYLQFFIRNIKDYHINVPAPNIINNIKLFALVIITVYSKTEKLILQTTYGVESFVKYLQILEFIYVIKAWKANI